MFKTKEEVKKIVITKQFPENINSYDIGVDNAFSSFAERIEFYKKYRITLNEYKKNNSMLGFQAGYERLRNDYPKTFKTANKDIKRIYGELSKRAYNEWLFDFCFGDVIG